jgi:ribosome-associated toxin RatA of RatAB toxin-antitoxin module
VRGADDAVRWKGTQVADQTKDSIEIAASPEEVMAVIADVGAYPEWVDAMKQVDILSTHADGKPDRVKIRLEHSVVADHYTLAYQWRPNVVSWHLVEGQLLKAMDGSYALKPSATGTTVTYALSVDLRMPMIGMFRRKAERTIIDGALKDLKQRVEA